MGMAWTESAELAETGNPKRELERGKGGFMRILSICICASLALWTVAEMATGASFDCARASSRSEKLICSDANLSTLDERLAESYRRAMKKAPDKDTLKKDQQNWIGTNRDACSDAPCMSAAYEARISALEGSPQRSIPQSLQDANEHFTYLSKPINPRAVQELLPWLSDTLPGPVAVDVQGSDSNRYFVEGVVAEKGVVTANWTEKGEKLSFSYKRLGVLGNGDHVLETWANGGGTLVSSTLILVKFLTDAEYAEGGKVRERLLMMRTGEFGLGDRYNGAIKVQPKEITIGPGGGVRTKPETIVFK